MITETELSAFLNWCVVLARIDQKILQTVEEISDTALHNLSARQNKAMMLVSHQQICCGRSISLNEFAAMLNIHKSAASLLVSGLVRKKLLCRTVDPDNRRYVKITLSAKGQKLLTGTMPHLLQKVEALLAPFTPEERQSFVSMADKLYQTVFVNHQDENIL